MTYEQKSNGNAAMYRRAVSGEPEAFWELVRPFERIVFSTALGVVRDPDKAQDVVHDTWVRAFSTLGNLRSPDKIGPWLHSMARNIAHEMLRKADRQVRRAAQAPTPHIVSVPAMMMAEEELRMLDAQLRELPEPHRVVLSLKYMNNLSCQQIAELLGIGVEATKSRLFEARRALRARMKAAESSAATHPAQDLRGEQRSQAMPAQEG
ncbi:RNA polymerase sigma factor [Candidatus Sumerlaeota bacterium]|nr:RNA polymerase sigma factor [Candidatus Sumerlaeota bacterium]